MAGIPGSPLMGLVAQGMDGRKKSFIGGAFQYTPGSYTFTAPQAGWWKFVLWGAGDSNGNATSGAYSEYTVFLGVNQNVALVVATANTLASALDTTATFPSGKVVTAGGAGASPGAASGGDVNLAGSASGAAGSGTGGGAAGSGNGAGAPANLPYRGGAGSGGSGQGHTPGGGAQTAGGFTGGDGMAIVSFVRS